MKFRSAWIVMMGIVLLAITKPAMAEQPSDQSEVDANLQYLNDELQSLRRELKSLKEGKTGFLLSGYGFAGFEDDEGQPSSFNAGFNPLFLWKLGDDILAEVELEIELDDGQTEIALEYAQLTYIVNDYITIGAGRFLSPGNVFIERLHPAWINKLPNAPLAVGSSALLPGTQLGVQVRGGVPLGPMKFEYALYVSNGPALSVAGPTLGQLEFNNFPDTNDGKAIGGRVGVFPFDSLELGYAIEYARVQPDGAGISKTRVVIQVADLNFVREYDPLGGRIDARAQWVWSDAGSFSIGALVFSNEQNGGYGQLSYRPSKLDTPVIRDLEVIGRYDRVDRAAGAPSNTDRQRWVVGLDYWLSPSAVLKTAYQFEQRDAPGGMPNPDVHSFRAQVALGF